MESMSISTFKATCLAVLQRVQDTGEPVLVTKRGRPVAEVVPHSATTSAARPLGALAGTATMLDDLVEPALPAEQWDALR